MAISPVDWAIVVGYFVLCTSIGLYFTRRGGDSLDQYFLSGRQAPWWLAGTAMVATTFAADTPLVVTGLVATKGVAGNWLWWNFVMSGMLTVFFFARLWRRAQVMTDVEFAEVRYSGRPAAFLRGFRALYLALPINLHHPRLGHPRDDQDPHHRAGPPGRLHPRLRRERRGHRGGDLLPHHRCSTRSPPACGPCSGPTSSSSSSR